MNANIKIAAILVAASTALAGCANSNNPAPITNPTMGSMGTPQYASAYGVVDSIQVVQASSGNSTLGTVAGGIVGGALGNQVGGGHGRTAATVAGAVGGAMLGNEVARNAAGSGQQAYQIGVRLDNGSYMTVQQASIGSLQIGSRVRVENGQVYQY